MRMPTPPAPRRGEETILLVEDDDAVRRFVLRVLTRGGYAVLEARGADEAILLSERRTDPIHLLLTDVVMPGMRGGELARLLRAAHPGMKVVFLSGYAEADAAEGAVRDGATAFLQKPIGAAALTRAVRGLLDGAAATGP